MKNRYEIVKKAGERIGYEVRKNGLYENSALTTWGARRIVRKLKRIDRGELRDKVVWREGDDL